MSVTIIVKKSGSSSRRPKFHAHFNRELNKHYYSERDYYSDMKAAGLEPYDPSSIKRHAPKPYKKSEWAKGMLKDIKDRNGRKPGDRFIHELAKKGYTKERADQAMKIAKGDSNEGF